MSKRLSEKICRADRLVRKYYRYSNPNKFKLAMLASMFNWPVCLSPSWVSWLNLVENVLGQNEQQKPLSPRWTTLIWASSLTFVVSLLPHSSQGHSFLLPFKTPCLRARWQLRPFPVENLAGQYPHRYGLGSSMWETFQKLSRGTAFLMWIMHVPDQKYPHPLLNIKYEFMGGLSPTQLHPQPFHTILVWPFCHSIWSTSLSQMSVTFYFIEISYL